MLRGVAAAHTAYDHPALRHCHDLDLLVRDGDGTQQHPSGFPISRHESLFGSGHPPVRIDDILGDTAQAEVAGVPARVLEPADAVVHICAHAATLGIRHSPLWPVDVAMVIRSAPDLDWDRVVARAGEWGFVGAVSAALTWLRGSLEVPVPAAVVRELRVRRLRRAPRRLLRLRPR